MRTVQNSENTKVVTVEYDYTTYVPYILGGGGGQYSFFSCISTSNISQSLSQQNNCFHIKTKTQFK